jgi:hypothetical protein
MTIALTISGKTPPRMLTIFEKISALSFNIRVIIAWLIFTLGTILINGLPLFNNDWVPDNDDLMRLVQVRDLLAGQGWFDMMQHRLDPPAGGFMHWSRIADIGIAAPMLMLRQILPGQMADALALMLYPAFILLAFLLVITKILRQLSGDHILVPALIVVLTCWSVMQQMTLGRIDHHGLQILLTFIALAQLLKAETLWSGFVAGVSMALSLGIGLETLAYVAVLQLAVLALWSWQLAHKIFVRGVGLGMVAGCALVVFGTINPALWFAPVNDAFGRSHAALLLLGGVAWIIVSWLPWMEWRQRLMAGSTAGLAATAVIVMACPEITQAPYATLDPYLKLWMLDYITEAAPFWKFAATSTMQATLYGLFLLSGLGSALYLTIIAATPAARSRWMVVTSLLAVASLIAMLQVRGFNFAHALALLPCTAMITHVRSLYPQRLSFILSSWVCLTTPGLFMICFSADYALKHLSSGSAVEHVALVDDCEKHQTLLALQGLPEAVILAPLNMGAPILAYTHHSVLAAPYHRVQRGMKDTIMAYRAPADQARSIVVRRQIDYVLYCKAMSETKVFQRGTPNSLMADLDHGKVPAWLQRVPLPTGNPLQLYRVTNETRRARHQK